MTGLSVVGRKQLTRGGAGGAFGPTSRWRPRRDARTTAARSAGRDCFRPPGRQGERSDLFSWAGGWRTRPVLVRAILDEVRRKSGQRVTTVPSASAASRSAGTRTRRPTCAAIPPFKWRARYPGAHVPNPQCATAEASGANLHACLHVVLHYRFASLSGEPPAQVATAGSDELEASPKRCVTLTQHEELRDRSYRAAHPARELAEAVAGADGVRGGCDAAKALGFNRKFGGDASDSARQAGRASESPARRLSRIARRRPWWRIQAPLLLGVARFAPLVGYCGHPRLPWRRLRRSSEPGVSRSATDASNQAKTRAPRAARQQSLVPLRCMEGSPDALAAAFASDGASASTSPSRRRLDLVQAGVCANVVETPQSSPSGKGGMSRTVEPLWLMSGCGRGL